MKKQVLSLPAILSIAAVILLVVGVCFFTGRTTKPAQPAELPAASAAETAEDSGTVIAKSGELKGMAVYPSGNYEAGVDLPAGEYLVVRDDTRIDADEVLVSVFGTNDYSINSMLVDLAFRSRGYVTVKEGQFLSITNGMAAPLEETAAYSSDDGTYPANMYRAGWDFPAGEYLLTGEAGTYALYRGGQTPTSLKASGSVTGRAYLSMREGDYLVFDGATLSDAAGADPLTERVLADGMYRVGLDLAPGTYTVTATGSHGYCTVQQGPEGSDGARDYLRTSLNEDAPTAEITLSEGEYLILCQAEITRPEG